MLLPWKSLCHTLALFVTFSVAHLLHAQYNSGIGGYTLGSPADQALAFDYDGSGKLDHLILYRPGTGLISILQNSGGTFSAVFMSSGGIADYDLQSPDDRMLAFDYYGTGKLDHLVVYRPGTGIVHVIEHGGGNIFYSVYSVSSGGIGNYDLSSPADRIIAFDYYGTGKLDHLLLYRPGSGIAWIIEHGAGNNFYAVYAENGAGIGYYDLSSSADRIIAFDYYGTGKLDHLLLYRPGSGIAWIIEHGAGNNFYPVYAQNGPGIGNYDLSSPTDQIIAFDYYGTGKLDHLLLYRPGSGIAWIIEHGTGNNFYAVYAENGAGIGYYDLSRPSDRIIAFDYSSTGNPDHLFLYRPGQGIAWIVQNAGGQFSPNYVASSITVALANLTHPDISPNFEVGDTFQVTITGAANQPVMLAHSWDGGSTMTQIGQTDAAGHFVTSGVENASQIGTYTDVYSVGDLPASPAISYVVGQLGGGGTVSTTDIGQTGDGSVAGISNLSVSNGTVSTYSATELDGNASLYYDAQTVGTLYQDGTAIAQGAAVAAGAAAGELSAAAVAWNTYDLQTDHYVVAYFFSGGYYENPLYLGDGSCYDASSDCTIGLGGGIYWIAAASIYLGSTLADQTNVLQDGSLPQFNDNLYDNFLASSQPPYPTGVVFKAEVKEWIKRLATVGLLVGTVATDVISNSPPVPYMVELLAPPAGDKYIANQNVINPPQGERLRTYILKDALGHPWPDAPVVVRERFSNKVGPGVLPAANGIWYNGPVPPDANANTTPLDQSRMTDHYALNKIFGQEVGFVQYYYASGFTAPSWLQLPSGFSLPGVTGLGLVVPLWIKDIYNSCERSLGGYYTVLAGQPVRFNPNYTGIDGDNGPPPVQGCAPPF